MLISRTINNEYWPDICVDANVQWIRGNYICDRTAHVSYDYRDSLFGELILKAGESLELTDNEMEQAEELVYTQESNYYKTQLSEREHSQEEAY